MKKLVLNLWIGGLAGLAFFALVLDGVEFFSIFDQGKRLAGLLGLVFLSVQFLLSSRLPVLERGLGQDTLIQYHRIFGILGLVIILLHGFLDTLYQVINWGTVIISLPYDLPKVQGMVATFLLLVIAVPAMFRASLKIPYDIWKRIHRISYLVFPMVLIHSIVLGTTIRYQPLALFLWILSASLFLIVVVYRIGVWIRKNRTPFLVADVDSTNHDITSLKLSGTVKDFLPGQFIFLQTKNRGKPSPAHPFTLSSSPNDREYRISAKAVGDFTREIPKVQKGDTVLVEGPYGWFTHVRFPVAYQLLFVAGGIGITPFMGMLRFLSVHDPERKVHLVWGNKTYRDLCFVEEFSEFFQKMPNLSLTLVFSEQNDSENQLPKALGIPRVGKDTGFIRSEHFDIGNKNILQTGAMVCGPPIMMKLVVGLLKNLGIEKKNILFEKFSL